MMRETDDLISSLVAAVRDYRGVRFDAAHVERWLDQFPEQEHGLILTELNSIMKRAYVSEQTASGMLGEIIGNRSIFSDSIDKYCFIDFEENDGNRDAMLEMLDAAITDVHGISIGDCGKGEVAAYIYIDDAIHSGRRLLRNIRAWARELDDLRAVTRLDIIVLAVHDRNLDHIKRKIGIALPYTRVFLWNFIEFKDRFHHSKTVFDSYWPSSEVAYNEEGTDYISRIVKTRYASENKDIPILRKRSHPKREDYFTSAGNRKRVERIFFEKGVELLGRAHRPDPDLRPMGYDPAKTLGFGSYLVTYMGISDHCPLVLWWEGDGTDEWYPLFPRTDARSR